MSKAEKAREILAGALNVPVADVGPETMIGVTEQWDSLAHMRLMLALEEALGRQLDMDAAVMIGTLADVEAQLG
ncbi:MAG: acyl carrier protein [Anderseniella sp.]